MITKTANVLMIVIANISLYDCLCVNPVTANQCNNRPVMR